MTDTEIDALWFQAMREATEAGEMFTRYRFAALVEWAHGAEVERLRRDCAEAYQVIGAAMLGTPTHYTQDDVERALDNLVAAMAGDPRPHDDLMPWPKVPERVRAAEFPIVEEARRAAKSQLTFYNQMRNLNVETIYLKLKEEK